MKVNHYHLDIQDTIMIQRQWLKSEVKYEALNDFILLAQVVDFKNKFYPATWAKFDDAKKGTIKLVPPIYRLATLKK